MGSFEEDRFPIGARVKIVGDVFDRAHGRGLDGKMFSYIGKIGTVREYFGRCHIVDIEGWVPYPEYGFLTHELDPVEVEEEEVVRSTSVDRFGFARSGLRIGDRVQLNEEQCPPSFMEAEWAGSVGTVVGNNSGYVVVFDTGHEKTYPIRYLKLEDPVRVGSSVELVPGHPYNRDMYACPGEVVEISGVLWPYKVRFESGVVGCFDRNELVEYNNED